MSLTTITDNGDGLFLNQTKVCILVIKNSHGMYPGWVGRTVTHGVSGGRDQTCLPPLWCSGWCFRSRVKRSGCRVFRLLDVNASMLEPRAIATTPERATSQCPRARINSIKALSFSGDPSTRKTKLFRVVSATRAPKISAIRSDSRR